MSHSFLQWATPVVFWLMAETKSPRDFRLVALCVASLLTVTQIDKYGLGRGLILFWCIVIYLVAPIISKVLCFVLPVKREIVEVVIYFMIFCLVKRGAEI